MAGGHVMVCRAVRSVVVVVVVLMMQTVTGQSSTYKHGWDMNVCQQQPNNPGTVLPNLPESFSLRVEANLLTKKRTTTLHEYYDYNANVAAVRQTENGQDEYFFYLYNSNQFLTLSPDGNGGNLCFKQDLAATDNHDMFGLKKTNATSDRIFSVSGALHFGGGIQENYIGQETVRGIQCNKWLSCQYWQDMDATSKVYWYFSDTSKWNSISGYAAPVRCHVTGTRWVNSSYSYTYDHIYEFYDFEADITADTNHFEVPPDTYCFSEVNTKPLPKFPTSFSFDSETLDLTASSIGFVHEEYDNLTNLVRLGYRDSPKANSPFDTRYIDQIHDFNTGIAYLIDVFRGNCTVTVIGQQEFDSVNLNGYQVRLKNPMEFMDLNHPYVYQGVRKMRGVDCDAWAAERLDYPDPNSKTNPATTWSWYFASDAWKRSMGIQSTQPLPIKLEIFTDDPRNPIHKHMSFYEYNVQEPNLLSWDISTCYGPQQSKNFAFLVPGRFQDLTQGNVRVFKYYMVSSLQAALGVSALRISKLDVQEAGDNVLVTFDLLDKAPLPGDVATTTSEPSLDQAYQTLSDAVNSGQLQVLLFSSLDKRTVKPAGEDYNDLIAASRSGRTYGSSSGFTGGAMGGMAVGMLVLGALLGFVILFAVYKLRGGTFGGGIAMKRFDNDQDKVVSPTNTDA